MIFNFLKGIVFNRARRCTLSRSGSLTNTKSTASLNGEKGHTCKMHNIGRRSLKAIWLEAAMQRNGHYYRGKVANEKLHYWGNIEIGNLTFPQAIARGKQFSSEWDVCVILCDSEESLTLSSP